MKNQQDNLGSQDGKIDLWIYLDWGKENRLQQIGC